MTGRNETGSIQKAANSTSRLTVENEVIDWLNDWLHVSVYRCNLKNQSHYSVNNCHRTFAAAATVLR